MPTPQKEQQIQEIGELLKGSSLTIMTDYRGLSVSQLQQFRADLRNSNASFRVVKNTLTGIAADQVGMSDIRPILEGPTAIIFSSEDPVGPAKTTQNFVRTSRILQIKGAMLDGAMISVSEVERLAALPSREVLLGRVVGQIQAPLSGLVNVLSGTIRSLAYVIQARQEQLGNES